MAATNTYTVNGEDAQVISAGAVDIDMSTERGVKAGCKEYPIPLLNKITVTSTDTGLSKSKTIYAGYKIVEQMLGAIVPAGNYNASTPLLNTIISNGRFGIFEPAHYNPLGGNWNIHNLNYRQIGSLLNIGTGVKICVKIEYTRSNTFAATVYVDIPGSSNGFSPINETTVPYYAQIGETTLPSTETVEERYIINASRRTWHESVLTRDILNINLSSSIVDPDTTQDMKVTLMAYIGSHPTADNTFQILPMNSGSQTSIAVQFQTYDPTIDIYNKDTTNNQDAYEDSYGSVADYSTGTQNDTTISIIIVAPE